MTIDDSAMRPFQYVGWSSSFAERAPRKLALQFQSELSMGRLDQARTRPEPENNLKL